MVLSQSDFSIPEPGESIDPTSPKDSGMRIAGMVVVFSIVIFAFRFAQNRGVGFLNGLADNVGLSSSGGSAWEGW